MYENNKFRVYQECWGRFRESQLRLFDMLLSLPREKSNILLISGDVHLGSISRMDCYSKASNFKDNNELLIHPIFEITSSGLTHSLGDDASFLMRNLMSVAFNASLDPDMVDTCVFRNINFGELNIVWDVSDMNDIELKQVKMDVMDVNANSQCSQELPINDKIERLESKKLFDSVMKSLETERIVCYPGSKISAWESTLSLARLYIIFGSVVLTPFAVLMVLLACLWCFCCRSRKARSTSASEKTKKTQ